MKHLKHPATIVAALALFIAFGGGAVAYASGLIPGSQIKNHSIAEKKLTSSAIHALKGQRGAPGPFPSAIPSGKTVVGSWAMNDDNAAGGTAETAISFVYPDGSRPTLVEVASGAATPAGCSGDVTHPGAAAGHLCVFVGWTNNANTAVPGEYDGSDVGGTNQQVGFVGAVLYNTGATAGSWEQAGTFAVTAP